MFFTSFFFFFAASHHILTDMPQQVLQILEFTSIILITRNQYNGAEHKSKRFSKFKYCIVYIMCTLTYAKILGLWIIISKKAFYNDHPKSIERKIRIRKLNWNLISKFEAKKSDPYE